MGVDQDRDTAVVVSGELDATTAPTLRDRLARVDADRGVVLDLSGVTFCDSVGLASVLEATDRDVEVRVVASPQVARVVRLTSARRPGRGSWKVDGVGERDWR